jgi:hypothetical protein
LKILGDKARYSPDDDEIYHKLPETYLLVSQETEYVYVPCTTIGLNTILLGTVLYVWWRKSSGNLNIRQAVSLTYLRRC